MPLQALLIISQPSMNSSSSYNPETPNLGQNRWILVLCDLEIWWMTLKNNRALVHNFTTIDKFKLELQSGNPSIWVKIGDFLSYVTLKFDGWYLKTIRYIVYAASSFVHNFVSIFKFKLEFRSGNTQIEAKFVLAFVTLTFDLWPCPFVWTSLLSMVIGLYENFMMLRWEEHSEKGVKDRQTDERTNRRTDGYRCS